MATVLQSASVDGNSNGPHSVTLTGVGPNHLLVIACWHYNIFGLVITDNVPGGLAWKTPGFGGVPASVSIYRGGPANDSLDLAYAFTGSHSGNVTITIDATASSSWTVLEVEGIDVTATATDAGVSASGTSSGAGVISAGGLTTTQANDFVFAAASTYNLGAGTSFSLNGILTIHNAGGVNYLATEYELSGPSGTIAASFSQGSAGTWLAAAMAFKAIPAPQVVACIPVGDIVINICKKAGIDPSLVDISLLTSANLKPTNLCCGYLITRPTQAAQILQTLMQAFFFDIMESGGKLRCVPRGMASAGTIPESDLGLEKDQAKLTEIIGMEQDLPREVTVLYNDENLDYQQGKQLKLRNARITSTRNQELVTLPLTMDATTARQIAEKMLYLRWLERNSYSMNLWQAKYLPYDPTDVLQFVYEGITFQMRVVDTTIGQGFAMAINGVGDNARNYLSSAQGATSTGPTPPPVDVGSQTMLWLFDIPLLRDSDTNPTGTGYSYAMSSAVQTWPGGILYKSSDDTSFAVEDTDNQPASFGYANNVLPAPRSPWSWDTVNKLNVTMVKGTLTSQSMLSVLNGQNALIYGNEIIQYLNATLEVDGTFTVDTLLRGRRGTEVYCGTHGANELVIDPYSGVKRFLDPSSILNQLRYYRGVTVGHDISTIVSQQFTITGNDLKPYAVSHLGGFIDGSGNIIITWLRRTRIGGDWIDSQGDVPLSEAAELYDVEIMNGASVIRTISNLTTPTAVYTVAQQTTDFGSSRTSVVVNVYQKSAVVGRGFKATATVPSNWPVPAAPQVAPGGSSGGQYFYVNGS